MEIRARSNFGLVYPAVRQYTRNVNKIITAAGVWLTATRSNLLEFKSHKFDIVLNMN